MYDIVLHTPLPDLHTVNILKKDSTYRCILDKFEKFLRTTFLQNTCKKVDFVVFTTA